MARVRVRKNFRFKDIDLRPSRAVMKAAGEDVVERIKARTEAGRDENNTRFSPLADGSSSTLTDTGQMLDDLAVVEATRERFGIGFRSKRSARIAQLHQEGTRGMPRRAFLGIDPKWIDAVVRTLKRAIGRAR